MPLDERSSRLRDLALIPSGGWLGEGVILLSDLLGLWDIFVLMVFFVVFWVIMRTAGCEISLALGLVFDLGIPLQYSNDPDSKAYHERHLLGYWPVFLTGSGVELAGYFFFHPDLFTLVVCIKTTLCLVLWLMKAPGGDAVVFGQGGGRSNRPAGSTGATDTHPIPIFDPRFPDAEAQLKRAGHTPLAIEGMLGHMAKSNETNAKQNFKKWAKMRPKDPVAWKKHQDKYVKEAFKNRGGQGISSGSAGGGGGAGVGGGGPAMTLDQDQCEQIFEKLAPWKERKHLSSSERKKVEEEARSRIKFLQSIKDANTLKHHLEKLDIVVESAAKLRLSDQLPVENQGPRFNRLIRPMAEKGLEIPRNTADLMMQDMLQQPTVDHANALYNSWKAITEMPAGKDRRALRDQVFNKYKEHVYIFRGKSGTTQRLIMPWDQDRSMWDTIPHR